LSVVYNYKYLYVSHKYVELNPSSVLNVFDFVDFQFNH